MITGQNKCRRLLTSLVVLTLLALLSMPRAVFANAEIYRKTLRSTTLVFTKVGGTYVAVGTGVLVNDKRGLVVTSLAAIGTTQNVAVCFPIFKNGKTVNDLASYTKHFDRIAIRGAVVATDSTRDLALIKLDSMPENSVALKPADDSSQPGDEILSITNYLSPENLWCYVSGFVRTVRRVKSASRIGTEQVRVVEVAVPLMPHSCGPVVNDKGELVGFFGKVIRNRLLGTFLDISEIKAFLLSNNFAWK